MKKKVLQLIETSGPGGAEAMLINFVQELSKGRYDPVVCLRKSGWLSQQLQSYGFEPVIIRQDGYLNCKWFCELRKIIMAEPIWLIHAHEFAMNTYGSILSCLTGVPLVTTVHGKSYYHEKWRRRFAYRMVAQWSKMVAVSKDIKNFLVTQVGIKEDYVTTIHNGIDVNSYGSYFDSAEQRSNGHKDYIIGAVGSLYPVKGHTFLLKALAIVLKTRSEVVCRIAGQGHLLPQLEAEATDLGISHRVNFLGLRSDIPEVLRDIDLFVLPSLSEGLPLSVLEAMAAGRPVIATDVGGVSEVVRDQITGFIVPPKDPEALAARILQIMADRSVAARFGRAGREKVEKDFSLGAMTKRYEKLYDQALLKSRWKPSPPDTCRVV